jgi:hypothetical protein
MSLEKNPTTGLVIEFFGPTLGFLTSPEDEHNDFCVLKGTIPPGSYVPLHSSFARDAEEVEARLGGVRPGRTRRPRVTSEQRAFPPASRPSASGQFIHAARKLQRHDCAKALDQEMLTV